MYKRQALHGPFNWCAFLGKKGFWAEGIPQVEADYTMHNRLRHDSPFPAPWWASSLLNPGNMGPSVSTQSRRALQSVSSCHGFTFIKRAEQGIIWVVRVSDCHEKSAMIPVISDSGYLAWMRQREIGEACSLWSLNLPTWNILPVAGFHLRSVVKI